MKWLRRILLILLSLVLLLLIVGGCAAARIARTNALNLVHPPRRDLTTTPAAYGMELWEEVRFEATDGLELEGWFVPPAPQTDGATIIFVHGFTANRENWIEQASLLHQHGYGALLFDLRGHGASEGDHTTFGFEEVADVQGAVDFLESRPDVNRDKIGMVGGSLGGSVAIRSMARTPEIQAVVIQSTFTSMEDNLAQGVEQLTGLPAFPFANMVAFFGERAVGNGMDISRVRPIDDIDDIAPRPLLIIHGTDDGLIDFRNGEALYAAAKEPKEKLWVEGADHYPVRDWAPALYDSTLVDFFATHMPNS